MKIKRAESLRKLLRNWFVQFSLIAILLSCDKKAGDSAEAAAWLTAVNTWKIEEIRVNNKPILKDGKVIQQFGGVEFSRYMETVQVKKEGQFEGKYNEGVAGTKLKWAQEKDQIVVSAADTSVSGGDWYIYTKDVTPQHFIMQTTTTAYDFPNSTKIELWYKAD